MFSIIGIVLVIVFYNIINNRISVVEKSLEELKKKEGSVSASVSPSSPIQASVPQPAFVKPVPSPVPAAPQESSEEKVGRTLGIIGVFAVLFGIGFFLKYAFDNNLIGITGRLILGTAVGVLAIVLGRLIKAKYANYGHLLSGGGIAVLFVTAFTAHILYGVISMPVAYVLFGIITALSVILSVMDGTMLLAGAGVAGGFIAPLLISFGGSEFIGLASYIFIINIGVAIIAYSYRWLALYYIALIGTMISVSSWVYRIDDGGMKYLFFVFVTLYFLTFLVASMFHHVVRHEKTSSSDLIFIMLTAMWYSTISYSLLHTMLPNGMGLFMAGIGIVYLLAGYVSFISNKEDRALNVCLPLIGVALITVAIPLYFDGSWITVAWIVESLVLALIDYAINGKRLYLYALIVYLIGLFRLFALDAQYSGDASDFMPVFNGRFALFAFAIVAGLVMAYVIKLASHDVGEGTQKDMEVVQPIPVFLGIITQATTLFLFSSEIHYYYSLKAAVVGFDPYNLGRNQENTLTSIVWALYAAFLTVVGFVIHSKAFRIFGLGLFLLTAVRIFLTLWELGPIYRIVTSIIFGIIALAASFLYAKYREKIKVLS